MLERAVTFDDGSRITWKGREALLYEEPGYMALLWVDYELGFFKRGRVLRSDSLDYWSVFPQGVDKAISPERKMQIADKVRQYFGKIPLRFA